MTYRAFGVDYFDSVLVANEIQGNFVRQIEKAHEVKRKYIAIVGSTYLDELANLRQSIKDNDSTQSVKSNNSVILSEAKNPNQNNANFLDSSATKSPQNDNNANPTILVSPSWGKETLLSKYGLNLLEPLAKSLYHIIIRPHPQSLVGEMESNNIKHLQNALKDYSNVEWDIGTPNVIAFQKADLMISDFSSVIFDFVCLEGKPVLTLDFTFDSAGYDLADIYDENNINEFWTFKALNQIGGKISESDFPHIQNIIDSALQSNANKNTLAKIKNTLWQHPHKAGEKSALEILKIQKNLVESQLNPYLLAQRDRLNRAIATLNNHSKDNNAI